MVLSSSPFVVSKNVTFLTKKRNLSQSVLVFLFLLLFSLSFSFFEHNYFLLSISILSVVSFMNCGNMIIFFKKILLNYLLSTDWPTDWLTDWLTEQPAYQSTHRLTALLTLRLSYWQTDWLDTVRFHKISMTKNSVKLRYFAQCYFFCSWNLTGKLNFWSELSVNENPLL